jgi:hypothetical protein
MHLFYNYVHPITEYFNDFLQMHIFLLFGILLLLTAKFSCVDFKKNLQCIE